MSSFTVPVDDLLPRAYQRLPNGKYRGTVQGLNKRTSEDSSWEAVTVEISDIHMPDGAQEIVNGDETISLKGQIRTSDSMCTVPSDKKSDPEKQAIARRIGRQQLTGLAWACGLVSEFEDDDGKLQVEGFEFEDTDDAIEQLEAGIGAEIGFSVKNEPMQERNEAGIYVNMKDENGNVRLTDNVKRIFHVRVLEQ